MNSEAYHLAQNALAALKASIYMILEAAPEAGYTNSEIGRSLGIYAGHVGHEGHISRTLLGLMESEGVVSQDAQSKRWTLKLNTAEQGAAANLAAMWRFCSDFRSAKERFHQSSDA